MLSSGGKEFALFEPELADDDGAGEGERDGVGDDDGEGACEDAIEEPQEQAGGGYREHAERDVFCGFGL